MTQATSQAWYNLSGPQSDTDTAAELFIYGDIGDDWSEHGVTAARLVSELSSLNASALRIRINSFGGSVPDALAIYHALRSHPAEKSVIVEGVALSSASFIAMAGDRVMMAEHGQLMIHAPWTSTSGNANKLRESAEVLDRFAKALATGYNRKTHVDFLPLLLDGVDHYFSAQEALDAGLIDEIITGNAAHNAASFDISRFTKGQSMTAPNLPEDTISVEASASPVPFARSKEDNLSVLAMFKPFAQHSGIADLKDAVLADPSLPVAAIQGQLLHMLGQHQESVNAQPGTPVAHLELQADAADKRRDAAVDAILARAGIVKPDLNGNPYRGFRMLDIARSSLQQLRVSVTGMDQMQIVANAFTQSGSDFPVLLENAMHKSLQAAYATAADTWRRFCATGSVSDFRAHSRYRVGTLSNLDSLSELGEFRNKTIPDGEKSSIAIGTKGNIINLSRQAMINDDLGAFVGLSATLGRAAARTIESAVYALLAENSGLGPAMSDTYTLFHANHGNITTGAALSVAALDADRVSMSNQRDISTNDYLDLRPQVLLVPMSLGGTARVLNAAEYDPDTANKLQKPNMVRGLFSDIVDSPRLTGTRRYLFASPSDAPVLEVAFLDGNQNPYLEMENGFTSDGARYKVRIDFGVAAIDYRGAVTNAGA